MDGSPPRNMTARVTPAAIGYWREQSSTFRKKRNASGIHIIELKVVTRFTTDMVKPENINVTPEMMAAGVLKAHPLARKYMNSPARKMCIKRNQLKAMSNGRI